ncbi:UDP-N-acetylmuramoyl-tripeptide--D-alanyl-D-alanine ligase [Parafrigoribacterium soli]|uniref:UDP-N-acetylmuramoyl-tripeptide--D-alanyl-D- alanine ligase n=1 Tax=Parafrigoribacterium soli TaxID=3144663 RepID=UPI0032EE5B6E
MITLTLAEIAAAVDGALELRDSASASDAVSGSVQTDSRLVVGGSIFFALRGETTDGHLFAEKAVTAGASLLVVERPLDLAVPQIVVTDGVVALGALAKEVVTRVRADGHLRVVGVTGSNGKTTTKNLLKAVLEAEGPTVAPQGSYNNQVGAPLSMLQINGQTRYLVVEMGAGGPGEVGNLAAIAKPDVAIVLKVGLAHAGVFRTLEATQAAKAEMVTGLPSSAVAILNADDGRVAAMESLTAARVVWFGLDERADPRAEDLVATASGTTFTLHSGSEHRQVTLRILGEHHVMNALATIAAVRELGVPVDSAVRAIESVARAERWRMELLHPGGGITIINDAYNASPDSTAAALKTLAQVVEPSQRSVAVLGEMAELGEVSDEEHDRIGRLVVRLNIQKLVVVGHAARHIHNAAGLEGSWDGESVLVADADEAYDLLRDELREGDIVLVKSSKSAELRFLGDRLGGVEA